MQNGASMAYRRVRDQWSVFIRDHAQELRLCGIPTEVSRYRLRFLVFLDHGFDQWGWATNHHACFNSNTLTDEQLHLLADFVARHFGEQYRATIASRWGQESTRG